MIKSIQHFEEVGIRNLEKEVEKFLKNPKDMASFVYGIQDNIIKLGLDIIKETLESCDETLRNSGKRKKDWQIVKKDEKTLITSLGKVCFEKTLFKNKVTGERGYLLDRILGIEEHERLTEDAEAKMLEESVETSYRKAGQAISISEIVSKQTVKNKIHSLEFQNEYKDLLNKKKVKYLYIDADEDHISLQFRERKGDLVKNDNHMKNNCIITKIVYVYEGIEKEGPKSKRNRLINPYYFCGTYSGEDNSKLWDEVYDYIRCNYDIDSIEKIYLNGDGGGWIKAGKRRLAGLTYVLDEFHLSKYMIRATSHLLDSAEEARQEMYKTMRSGTKREFEKVIEKILKVTDGEATIKRVKESKEYILSNWSAVKVRLEEKEGIVGCSAEGHVSHVLSSRMSSRPMGWSRMGVDKMAHLRAYYYNGGDMLELVRKQRRQTKAAGAEENDIISCEEVLRSEKNKRNELGKYMESISHSVSADVRKYAWFNAHIWGL
ncbi:ISLre2 family transposase [Lachnospiraceae bacterium MD1]|jgi:hypothetical protein|uniref:ISLre2 family transposase n=1 Tax=Variimorphobacter saccharofermentans TaxID=2755051 RepID=A0A839JZP2_9FIRM|nr:ISLre2 family transposase [Variimorphobacter saccharofermentans]MBB2182432.1 ISLre2 family transposase [Variimorphobacter saccharofermentans]MBB2183764.1 ISLre2 family transposase [Variimorphobacter saccharofermentans]